MNNKTGLKLIVFVLLLSIFPYPSEAFYKKKVLVGQFQNPANWDKPYHPGNIIAELIARELLRQKRYQVISATGNMMPEMSSQYSSPDENGVEPAILDYRKTNFPEILFIQNPASEVRKPGMGGKSDKMDQDSLWPVALGETPKKSAYTEVRGKIIKFLPDMDDDSGSLQREKAEIQIHIELVQNKTGRVLNEKTFKISSSTGTEPFSTEKLNSPNGYGTPGLSSMNKALNSLRRQLGSYIAEVLDSLLLEGEIIASKRKEIYKNGIEEPEIEEEILINLGSSNGIRIGDQLQVDAVGLRLKDLYTPMDLGDVYVRAGVIQILHTWEGTAKAIPLAGKDFETGFIVRSITPFRKRGLSSTNINPIGLEEEVPWWEFHGIRSVN